MCLEANTPAVASSPTRESGGSPKALHTPASNTRTCSTRAVSMRTYEQDQASEEASASEIHWGFQEEAAVASGWVGQGLSHSGC